MPEFTVEEQFTPARTVTLIQSNLGFEATAPLKRSAPWRAARKSHPSRAKLAWVPNLRAQNVAENGQRLCTLGVCISTLCTRPWRCSNWYVRVGLDLEEPSNRLRHSNILHLALRYKDSAPWGSALFALKTLRLGGLRLNPPHSAQKATCSLPQ